jgi:phosphoglycolate phosphatase-like HAD superfamily hydrolase
MSFYVFDLDGTLADCSHRLPMLDGTNDGWRRFYAACADDKPIEGTISLAKLLAEAGHEVEIWSGRSAEAREQTAEWLRANGMNFCVRMRPEGDHRPDHELKAEFLQESRQRPALVFEDRSRVVRMWREQGIPCFQVADGDF